MLCPPQITAAKENNNSHNRLLSECSSSHSSVVNLHSMVHVKERKEKKSKCLVVLALEH